MAKKGFLQTGKYHVDVGGTWMQATPTLKPLIDPKLRVQGVYPDLSEGTGCKGA